MSQAERTGVRCLIYSGWHRAENIRQYVGVRIASQLTMVDVDGCEACFCYKPIALIETQQSRFAPKKAEITRQLAEMAGIIALSVSYETDCDDVTVMFHVKQ